MLKDKKILTFISFIMSLMLFSFQVFAQSGKIYEGPEDPAGDRTALREGFMDGNQVLVSFRNYGQVGRRGLVNGMVWPKDSEKGMQIFDQMTILIGAQVFLENDTIPVYDEAQIASRTDLDTLYFMQAAWNYEGMLDQNPDGDITWALHPVPGYFNPLSETPALSKDPSSWPTDGWPSRGFEKKWPPDSLSPEGYWNGRFGKGVKYAQLETYFVCNDAQDQEYLQSDRRVKYYPRPGVNIGDINPGVTIQKGLPWGGLGLRVEVRGYQWENPQTRDVLFWEYNISNVSDYTIPRTAFGYMIDMGVGGMPMAADDSDDMGGFVKSSDLAFVWDANDMGFGGWSPGVLGVAFLESPGINSDGIDNDNDGLTDEARDNFATEIVGPTDGISDIAKFLEAYGYTSVDQLKDHWDADEDQDWKDGVDENGNGIYDNGEVAGDDVGLDGIGPSDINYPGPDKDGTECNHKPDLLEGLNSEPNFGLTDVSESDMLGLTSFHYIPWSKIEPREDFEFYNLIGTPELVPATFVPADYSPIFGSGPFPLLRGTTERYSCAMIGAYENIDNLNAGGEPYTIIEKKRIVQLIYESDYRFAQPPVMPTLKAFAQDGKVVLTWNDNAEKFTREPLLGGENDFEGYKLYKSTDRFFADAARVYDGHGNLSGRVPIFQCDLKNDYYGFTDFGLLEGESFFLGYNTEIQHYYVDENVQNGRTYYYYLVAYDHGISGIDANIAPTENVPSIIADEDENIVYISPNVQIVTPHQFATDYVSPNLEITTPNGDIAGTGTISFDALIPEDLKAGNEYKLSFLVDTVTIFRKIPSMGYVYRNIGFKVTDITDTNRIMFQESPEYSVGGHVQYDIGQKYYYMQSDIKLDPFEGIQVEWSDVPSKGAEYDPEKSGWIVGDAQIQVAIDEDAYKLFPWQTEVVFTSGDITSTTMAADISKIRKAPGIASTDFDKSLLLPDQTFNFYVENKQFQDSTGAPYLLDVLAYDADTSGTFDILKDYVLIGYSSIDKDVRKWWLTIATFNFRNITSAEELPAPGDVYRIDSKRPFTASDEFIMKVIEPSDQEKQEAEDLDEIQVVPNPYIVTNMMEPAVRNVFLNQRRRLMFTHIPSECEIKIFTISGYFVDEIDVTNEPSNGIVHWDLLTHEGLEIGPGVYVYYLKSKKTGDVKTGKFAVIK